MFFCLHRIKKRIRNTLNYYNSFTWKCINLKRLVVDVKVHQGQVVFQKAPSNSSLLPIFSYILTLMLVVLLSQTMDSRWLLYAQKAAKIFYWRSFEMNVEGITGSKTNAAEDNILCCFIVLSLSRLEFIPQQTDYC